MVPTGQTPSGGGGEDRNAALDAIRGLAALAVFAGHLRGLFFVNYADAPHGWVLAQVYFLTSLGHTAVMVFFVLSGYFVGGSVISAFISKRWSLARYLITRLTRLWIVLVPALVLTAVLDLLGSWVTKGGGLYSGGLPGEFIIQWSIPSRDSLAVGIGNAAFLQQIIVPPFGSNGPLWSLSYEFWYYMLFPLLFAAAVGHAALPRRLAMLAVAVAILAFVGREITAYFAVWLLGAGAAWLRIVRPLPLMRPGVQSTLAVLLLVAGIVATRFVGNVGDAEVAMAAAGAVALLCTRSYDSRPVFGRLAGGLAGMSYTLYVVHLPFLVLVRGLLSPVERWSPDLRHAAVVTVIGVVVFAVAWLISRVTEARTDAVRRWVVGRNALSPAPHEFGGSSP